METLIEQIRTAIAEDATTDARIAGANACRTILAALDVKAGEPLVSAPAPTQVQAIIGALSNTPPEQLLDLAIAKLRAALPAGTELPAVQAVKLPILNISALGVPHVRGR